MRKKRLFLSPLVCDVLVEEPKLTDANITWLAHHSFHSHSKPFEVDATISPSTTTRPLTFYRRENRLREVKDMSSVKQLGNGLLGFEPICRAQVLTHQPTWMWAVPAPHCHVENVCTRPASVWNASALLIRTTIPWGGYHYCPHFTDEQTVRRLPSVHWRHSLTVWLRVWFAAAVGNCTQLRLLLWDLWEGKWYSEKRAYIWSLNVAETVVEFYCFYNFHPTRNSGNEWEGKGSGVKGPGRCEQWWVHLRATVSKCY